MTHRNHLGRWIVAGASALVLAGAGTAAASSVPVGSAAESAGPSNCPTIPAASDSTGSTPDASAAPGASSTPMESASSAAPASAPAGSAAMEAGPFVQIAESEEYGAILVDGACRTLYAFANDTPGTSACLEACAEAWPPLTVADGVVPALADELDPSLFVVIEHSESGPMLQVGDWPLYYFASDAAPGDIDGQGVGDVWWLVAPDGSLIQSASGSTAPAGTDAGAAAGTPMDTASMTSAATTSGDGY